MSGSTGYSLGFFCGCLVGAVGTYLAFTPDGHNLKQTILQEFKRNQELVTSSTETIPELESVKLWLSRLRHKLNPTKNSKPIPQIELVTKKSSTKRYFKQK